MKTLIALFELLLCIVRPPKNATPDELLSWHWRIAACVLGLMLVVGWIITMAGYARAADIDTTVQAKVSALLAPVTADVAQIKAKQSEQGDKLDASIRAQREQLLTSVRAQVVDFKIKQCKSVGNLSAVYRDQVQRLLDQYLQISGSSFQAPLCADL